MFSKKKFINFQIARYLVRKWHEKQLEWQEKKTKKKRIPLCRQVDYVYVPTKVRPNGIAFYELMARIVACDSAARTWIYDRYEFLT